MPSPSPDDRTLAFPTADRDAPTIPGYRIVRRLGEGGMGAVYLAEETALGRNVAIKVISERVARNAEMRARFLREARLLATVEHPNVVRVYTFGMTDDRAYLVMEYIEGETLSDRIRRTGQMKVDDALDIVREIVGALDAAWEKRVIHRDIKPSNILFDRRGQLKVADFGLAKGIEASDKDSSLTQTGYLLGSPHYVAPEQAQGRDSDFRADIYSLGVMLYEMLTARKPFDATTPFAVVAMHLSEPMPQIRALRPDVSEPVVELLQWMTAKDPASRPQSYAELRKALGDEAEPTMRATLRARVPQRRRGNAPGLIAAIVLVVAALVGTWALVRRHETIAPQTAGDDRLTIAITPFYGPDPESVKEGRVMAALVERAVAARLGASDVRVIGIEETKTPARDHDGARALGQRLGASLVIWGDAFTLRGETEVQPSVTIVPQGSGGNEPKARTRGNVDALAALQTTARVVRVETAAPNQIEMRKTSAEGIGDLVTYIAATYVLHEQADPQRALELLAQARPTPDTHYQRAICDVQLQKDEDAEGELNAALALDPKHAPSLALLGDIAARRQRWADAIARTREAVAARPDVTFTEAAWFDGKLYFKERWMNREESMQTPNLLALDPQTLHVIERHRLPGVPISLHVERGSTLVIRYIPDQQRPEATGVVRYARGRYDPPVTTYGSLLVRMSAMKAGWVHGTNFLLEATVASPERKNPRFVYHEQNSDPALPKTLPDAIAALRRAIEHDPTQPWYLIQLGMAEHAAGNGAASVAAFTRAFEQPFDEIAYFDYAWMARQLEALGHHRWADRAYEEALRRRQKLPQPVQGSTLIERMINTPFVRGAAFMSRYNPDPDRHHLWLVRARELSGLCGEGDDLAASAWARYYDEKGDAAKASAEREIVSRVRKLPSHWVMLTAWADVMIYAALAALAAAIAGAVWFAIRGHRRGAPNVVRAIGRRERVAIVVAALLAVVCLSFATGAALRALSPSVPIGLADGLGDPFVIQFLEQELERNPSFEMRFIVATANHMGGNATRASDLYRTLTGNDATKNLRALQRRKRPEVIPGIEDAARVMRYVPPGAWRDQLRLAFDVWTGRVAHSIDSAEHLMYLLSVLWWVSVFAAVALAAVFLAVPAHDAVPSPVVRPLLIAVAIAFLVIAMAGQRYAVAKEKIIGVGMFSSRMLPSYESAYPFPPMPDAIAAQRKARESSDVMRLYRMFLIAAGLLAAATLTPALIALVRRARGGSAADRAAYSAT